MRLRSLQKTICGDSQYVQDNLHRSSALAAIRSNCLNPLDIEDGTTWWDTAIAPNDIEADLVAQGITYLESIGQLIRHHKRPTWIQLRQPIWQDDVFL